MGTVSPYPAWTSAEIPLGPPFMPVDSAMKRTTFSETPACWREPRSSGVRSWESRGIRARTYAMIESSEIPACDIRTTSSRMRLLKCLAAGRAGAGCARAGTFIRNPVERIATVRRVGFMAGLPLCTGQYSAPGERPNAMVLMCRSSRRAGLRGRARAEVIEELLVSREDPPFRRPVRFERPDALLVRAAEQDAVGTGEHVEAALHHRVLDLGLRQQEGQL